MIAWRFELDGSRQNERRESLGRINFAFSRDVTGANERQTEQTRRQRGYQLPTGDLRNSASPLRLLTLLGVVGPFDVHKGRERGLSRGKTMRRPRSDLDSLRGPSDSPWSKQEIENDGCFTGRASAVVRPSSLCSSLTAKGNHWQRLRGTWRKAGLFRGKKHCISRKRWWISIGIDGFTDGCEIMRIFEKGSWEMAGFQRFLDRVILGSWGI